MEQERLERCEGILQRGLRTFTEVGNALLTIWAARLWTPRPTKSRSPACSLTTWTSTVRFVSLDALHTQTETGRDIVLEHGGHYLFTAKDNQPTVHQIIEKLLPAPKADFPPLGADSHSVPHSGT